ncbi:hypothetical protein ACOJQI_20400 [Bacillus salacetis]|uniref:hypothetical protein n=1 Tax=Bacillus salacetis TaxID=2315464 RepID=UPI003BA22B4D
MLKQKLKVSLISILASTILLPLFFPIDMPFSFSAADYLASYSKSFLFYAGFGGIFMILIGLPVNFIAGLITKYTAKFTHIANFVIHLLPAILFGGLIFPFSWPDSLPFMAMPAFSAAIFFIVDEILFHKVNLRSHKAKLIFLIPPAAYILFMSPTLITHLQTEIIKAQIDKKGAPVVTATINGQAAPIRSTYCWTNDGEGCVYDTEPFILPRARGIEGLEGEVPFTESPADLTFDFQNSAGEPSCYAYYHDGTKVKKVKIEDLTLKLPDNMPDQLVRFLAEWDTHEKVWFYVGVYEEE